MRKRESWKRTQLMRHANYRGITLTAMYPTLLIMCHFLSKKAFSKKQKRFCSAQTTLLTPIHGFQVSIQDFSTLLARHGKSG